MKFMFPLILCASTVILRVASADVVPAAAPVILNEYNAVEETGYLRDDGSDVRFGRVAGNGGDWFELVVVGNGDSGGKVDMRGWRIEISEDEKPAGAVALSHHEYWGAVRAGTILTFIENDTKRGGLDTGILLADRFEEDTPLGGWGWSNFRIGDEEYLNPAGASEAITLSSRDIQVVVKDDTGRVMFGPAGEGVQPRGGIGHDEVFRLANHPYRSIDPLDSGYGGGNLSTFGAPNVWDDNGDRIQIFGQVTDLIPAGELDPVINESSGIVMSRRHSNVFWTHNDSGDKARIFAVNENGELIKEISIPNASHVDWEDITLDGSGNLIIGDVGNNSHARKDLALYILPEPDPETDSEKRVLMKLPVRYPDQASFPPSDIETRNFDCEGVFWANGRLYFLTKHTNGRNTWLYRLDTEDEAGNVLTKIGEEFSIGDKVTGADASPDGERLAVLTRSAVWVFHKPDRSDDYLSGRYQWMAVAGGQIEAICWSGADNLMLTSEQGHLFRVEL